MESKQSLQESVVKNYGFIHMALQKSIIIIIIIIKTTGTHSALLCLFSHVNFNPISCFSSFGSTSWWIHSLNN